MLLCSVGISFIKVKGRLDLTCPCKELNLLSDSGQCVCPFSCCIRGGRGRGKCTQGLRLRDKPPHTISCNLGMCAMVPTLRMNIHRAQGLL